jgi:hypothetical protein
MEKKLYRVKVVLYVMAENEADACGAATQAHFDIFECAARKVDRVTPEWNEAIPYNADDERTCLEIIKGQDSVSQVERQHAELPPYVKTAIRNFNNGNSLSQASRPV